MTDLCAAAIQKKPAPEFIAALRKEAFSKEGVKARREAKESRWWAYESKFLRAALVAMVFERLPLTYSSVTTVERNVIAKNEWLKISEPLREEIKNEMARLAKLSYKAMGGE